jgi:hypothetical protein
MAGYNWVTGQWEDDANAIGTDVSKSISVDPSKYINDTTPKVTGSTVNVAAPTSSGLAYNSVISGSNAWTPEQWQNFGSQGGTIDANNNLVFGTKGLQTGVTKEPGMFDWLGSDNMKGISTIGGLGLGAFNIFNSMNAQEQAKKQWSAENARADKILGMNTERYEQWKADKSRLNSQYA